MSIIKKQKEIILKLAKIRVKQAETIKKLVKMLNKNQNNKTLAQKL